MKNNHVVFKTATIANFKDMVTDVFEYDTYQYMAKLICRGVTLEGFRVNFDYAVKRFPKDPSKILIVHIPSEKGLKVERTN